MGNFFIFHSVHSFGITQKKEHEKEVNKKEKYKQEEIYI